MFTDLVMDTEVLLKIESVLGHPEWVPHVGLDKLHPLDTLVTCEPGHGDTECQHSIMTQCYSLSGFGRLVWVTGSPGLADVSRPVHKEVLDARIRGRIHKHVRVTCMIMLSIPM